MTAEPRDDNDGAAEVYDPGELELAERHSLRRVGGLSTELEDVSEVEYRALRLERVVLLGGWTEGTLAQAENSLRELALLVSEEPELAAGRTAAVFGAAHAVRQLRLQIGRRIHQRIEAAAGPGSGAARLLELAYFGAMVEAGLGYTTYGHMADRLAEAAELIMG